MGSNPSPGLKPSGARTIQAWLLAFAVCYAVFHILPAFMNIEVAHRLMIADLFDLLTPYVMVFLVGALYLALTGDRDLSRRVKTAGIVLVLLGIVTFIEGHGMHLSANAIGRHLSASPPSSLFALDYFFDEILGHILWDAGLAIIAAGIILIGSNRDPAPAGSPFPWLALAAAPIYGFTYFVNAIEGQTVPFTFPLAVLLAGAMLWSWPRRKNRLGNPVYVMFLFAWLTAICLFAVWWTWHAGFPEFSDLGWI
jgi:hypothetical protein